MAGSKKGFTQTDYIVAIGVFIFMFGSAVFFLNSYLGNLRQDAEIASLTNNALSLLALADSEGSPKGWPELSADPPAVFLMHFSGNNTASSGVEESALGHNGSVAGTAYFNISGGRFGSAWTFYGSGYVDVPHNDSWAFGLENFTIQIYGRFSSTGNAALMGTSQGAGNQRKWYISYDSGSLKFLFNTGGGDITPVSYSFTPNTSLWYHVAVVRSGANFSLYLNGTAVSSGTDSSSIPDVVASLTIGQVGSSMYFNGTLDEAKIEKKALTAEEIMKNAVPELRLDKTGLKTGIYRINVLVGNSRNFWYSPPANLSNLSNETVSFNISRVIGNCNPDSINVYDESNRTIAYQFAGGNLSFNIPAINVGESKWFKIYAQSGGVFPSRSVTVSGNDNLSQVVMAPEKIDVLGYDRMKNLNAANYTIARRTLDAGNFRVRIFDTNSSSYVFDFGDEVPRRGNVVAFQRYFLVQNSTGGIGEARITAQTW